MAQNKLRVDLYMFHNDKQIDGFSAVAPVTDYQAWESKSVRTEALKAMLYEVLRSLADE